MNKYYCIIGAVIIVAIAIALQQNSQARACTEEAKLCPDGSAVGRVAPNCDFAPCPSSVSEQKEDLCTASGGIVRTQLCCKSVEDFPNTCLIGACGCSTDNSKEVKACDCGEGKCWNGYECAAS